MPKHGEFVEFVIEQMVSIGGLRVRAMFGGHGVYQDDCIFAIIIDDRLYFKTDATTRGEFEALGLSPFTYLACSKPVTMSYFEAPPEVFEELEVMGNWAQKALGASRRAREFKKEPRRSRKKES